MFETRTSSRSQKPDYMIILNVDETWWFKMTICGFFFFVLFCFFFFFIRPHYYAETLSTYYDEEVVIGEAGQKPAGKFYVNCNL